MLVSRREKSRKRNFQKCIFNNILINKVEYFQSESEDEMTKDDEVDTAPVKFKNDDSTQGSEHI